MSDLISRQAAIDAFTDAVNDLWALDAEDINTVFQRLPPAQKKGYTKADYIMALHKEYGCSISRAEEAHQKALEYLRNTSIIKG